MKAKKLLILGGGFGGVYTYLNILRSRSSSGLNITIVSKSENFTFTPMLTEYFAGDINLKDFQIPLSDLSNHKNTKVHIAEVIDIDYETRKVTTTSGKLDYDYLVVSLGSEANFYDIPGAKESSLIFRNNDDAIKLKQQITANINKAKDTKDKVEKIRLLTVAVIGGGPTGVELASRISELNGSDNLDRLNVQIIEAAGDILNMLKPNLRLKADKILNKKGITVKRNRSISEIREDNILFSDNNTLATAAIVWTAGIKPIVPSNNLSKLNNNKGQIIVDQYLRVKGYNNAFAIGDMAKIDDYNQILPASAQVSVAESKTVSINILNSLKGSKQLQKFHYHSKSIFIPLGKGQGVGMIAGFNISGHLVWIAWKLIYVMRFPIPSKRLPILFNWITTSFKN